MRGANCAVHRRVLAHEIEARMRSSTQRTREGGIKTGRAILLPSPISGGIRSIGEGGRGVVNHLSGGPVGYFGLPDEKVKVEERLALVCIAGIDNLERVRALSEGGGAEQHLLLHVGDRMSVQLDSTRVDYDKKDQIT